MTKLARWWWLVPISLLLIVYWPGLTAWFMMDDFAWLSLRRHIYSAADLPRTFFAPMAQGTIRTLSERLYFLTLFELFGMRALPFRIVAFATAAGAAVFVGLLTRRLAGSWLAATLAACFWLANDGLPTPMYWSSAYNQVLMTFLFGLGLWNWARYCASGERKYLIYQWISFLLGFGVLELNVVYPVLAAAYAVFLAPRYLGPALVMFPVSVAYAVAHRTFSAGKAPDFYKLYFDADLPRTLTRYWHWLMAAGRAVDFGFLTRSAAVAVTVVFTVGLVAFAVSRWRKGERGVAFCLAWYGIAMAPYLPVKLHVSEYYAVVPSVGIAMLAAWGIAWALQGGIRRWPAWVALLLAAGFFSLSLPIRYKATAWHTRRSHRVRDLVQAMTGVTQSNPKSMILLDQVDADLFYTGVYDHPWYCLGITAIYLTPESRQRVLADPGTSPGDVQGYDQPPAVVYRGLLEGQIQVYDVTARPLRNTTSTYARRLLSAGEPPPPASVFPGQKLYQPYLSGTWFEPEETHRWMGREASVRVGGPGSTLRISAIIPDFLVRERAARLEIFADGVRIGESKLEATSEEWVGRYPVRADDAGRVCQVTLRLDRTARPPGDSRELGIAVSRVWRE
jgi:hypothetical protein